jgi:hypothetical protein
MADWQNNLAGNLQLPICKRIGESSKGTRYRILHGNHGSLAAAVFNRAKRRL